MPALDVQNLQTLAATMPAEMQKSLGAVLRAQDDINRRIKQLFANLELEVESAGVALSDNSPIGLGTTDPGTGDEASRWDHVHAHGDLAGGTLHAVAVASVSAGFISATDQARLDKFMTLGQVLAMTRGWALP